MMKSSNSEPTDKKKKRSHQRWGRFFIAQSQKSVATNSEIWYNTNKQNNHFLHGKETL